jgi:hypothetical protein
VTENGGHNTKIFRHGRHDSEAGQDLFGNQKPAQIGPFVYINRGCRKPAPKARHRCLVSVYNVQFGLIKSSWEPARSAKILCSENGGLIFSAAIKLSEKTMVDSHNSLCHSLP